MPRVNRTLVYLGACIIAGLRLAREKQVNVRVIPTSAAIEESVDLAHEIFNRVFRRVPDRVDAK
jgi:MinD-like ATPase involved in chromosome partitioning or flagellar assembly